MLGGSFLEVRGRKILTETKGSCKKIQGGKKDDKYHGRVEGKSEYPSDVCIVLGVLFHQLDFRRANPWDL